MIGVKTASCSCPHPRSRPFCLVFWTSSPPPHQLLILHTKTPHLQQCPFIQLSTKPPFYPSQSPSNYPTINPPNPSQQHVPTPPPQPSPSVSHLIPKTPQSPPPQSPLPPHHPPPRASQSVSSNYPKFAKLPTCVPKSSLMLNANTLGHKHHFLAHKSHFLVYFVGFVID